MNQTTTSLTFALALTVTPLFGCQALEFDLSADVGETGETGDGLVVGAPDALDDPTVACDFAWQTKIKPVPPGLVDVAPLAIADLGEDGFVVYGSTIVDFSAHLWIGAFANDGRFEDAVQMDPQATASTEIWASDTDGAGNLVVFAKLVHSPGAEPTPVIAHIQPDGTQTWRRTLPSDIEAEFDEVGLAAAPSGAIAVSASRRVSDEDTDVWLARVDPASGEIAWETSLSGPVEGGWSIDSGGPVAIDDDGSMFVLGQLRHDYQTFEATLAAFDGVDLAPIWTAIPIADTANSEQRGGALELDPDGTVHASVNVETSNGRHSVVAAYAEGKRLWSTSTDELDWDGGAEFIVRAIAPDGVGGASIVGEFAVGTFLVELDATGAPGCMSQWGANGDLFRVTGITRSQDGTLLMAAYPGQDDYPAGPGWVGAYAF